MSQQHFLTILPIFFVSVILHECAHGWVAYKLGDPTAKISGRLTLNPLKHIDPIGTVVLPIMLIIVNSPVVFGWAKPIPVNFRNLNNPKRDMIWVGISGSATNVILSVFLSQILKLNIFPAAVDILKIGIIINLVLAIFNMIPIPPLDGSRLVMGLLPDRFAYMYSRIEPYGIIIVFAMLYLGLFQQLVWPIVITLAKALGV